MTRRCRDVERQEPYAPLKGVLPSGGLFVMCASAPWATDTMTRGVDHGLRVSTPMDSVEVTSMDTDEIPSADRVEVMASKSPSTHVAPV